ncbi:hypothetical protein GCM10010187_53400 [Actinomadura coerulea]|nr:hypothetical protein GCM10010187_53400 [Actinomadura coerulea]
MTTRDTVWCDTPASWATSAMIGGFDEPWSATVSSSALAPVPGLMRTADCEREHFTRQDPGRDEPQGSSGVPASAARRRAARATARGREEASSEPD